jgi:hypothetical protein
MVEGEDNGLLFADDGRVGLAREGVDHDDIILLTSYCSFPQFVLHAANVQNPDKLRKSFFLMHYISCFVVLCLQIFKDDLHDLVGQALEHLDV